MKFDLLLYGITDRAWVGTLSLEEQIEKALQGGVTMLQLREKSLSRENFLEEAIRVKRIADCYQVPLIINDDIQVALASEPRCSSGSGRPSGIGGQEAPGSGTDSGSDGQVRGTSQKGTGRRSRLSGKRSSLRHFHKEGRPAHDIGNFAADYRSSDHSCGSHWRHYR